MTHRDTAGWFVAQLRPQGLLQACRHLHRQGFETFFPEIAHVQWRQGKPHPARRPLFPGYLFINFDPKVPGWTAINNTRGISRLILSDPRQPVALPASLMAGLRARCDGRGLITAPDDLAVGDRVRVLSGPFAEMITKIETLPDVDRIGVLLELMGREVRTSLPRVHITKVS